MADEYFKPEADKQIEDEEDDDCVIFKGSPLYESLKQSGYEMTEAEVVNTSKSEIEDHFQGKQSVGKNWEENKNEDNASPLFGRLKQKALNISNMMVGIFTRHFDWKNQRRESTLLILDRLKHCSTLDEDDAVFIEWFVDTPVEDNVPYSSYSRMTKWFYFMISPIILSYGYGRTFHTVPGIEIAWFADFLTILVLGHWTILAGNYVVKYMYKHRYKLEERGVDDLLSGCEKFLLTMKKSIRLIQETELIARGFTLVSQRNPLSRLEEGQKQTVRQCPALRKLVFMCSRDSIHLHREKIRYLLQLLPSNPEIDIKSGNLAFEPLENYGPCLQLVSKERDCDEHIYNLTDGYSVSALKGISHLLMLHISEFIKCLALLYHHDYKYADLDHKQVLNITKNTSQKITSQAESLQRSVDFHTNSFVSKDRDSKRKTGSKYDDLFTAVHSLDLHLQSALTRVRSLASEIESHIASNNHSEMSHDPINKMMQPIKAELTSCSNCYSEVLNRLDILYGVTKTKVSEECTEKVSLQSNHGENNVKKDNIRELEDHIIVDQVFEAYTDPDEITKDDTEWEKPLTAEEKEKKRKEKEEALRMMMELKSVIKVRAKETEKREITALNRNIQNLQQTLDSAKTIGASLTTTTTTDNAYDFDWKQYDAVSDSDATRTIKRSSTDNVDNMDLKQKQNCGVNDSDAEKDTENLHLVETKRTEEDVYSTLSTNQSTENQTKSVVTHMGVRRLRKGNMLDDSDSDEEILDVSTETSGRDPIKPSLRTIYTTLSSIPNNKVNKGELNTHKSDEDSSIISKEDTFAFNKHETENYVHDNNIDGNKDDGDCNQESKPSLSSLTLEERLAKYSGLNLSLTSNIAVMAAAKSKEFCKLEETAFGEEEEFGELYEDESDLES